MNSVYSASTSIVDVTDKVIKAMGMTRTKLEDLLVKGESGSLTKQVAGSVSQFPVIITNDHPVPFATLLAEMLELQYANYLTLALSNSPRVDIGDINDRKYLKKYHSNLKKMESLMAVLSESFDEESPIESSIAIKLLDSITEGIEVKPAVRNRLISLMKEGFEEQKQIKGLEWLMEAGKVDDPDHDYKRKYHPQEMADQKEDDRRSDRTKKQADDAEEKQYKRGRDAAQDAKKDDDTAYSRQRDAATDARKDDETAYKRGKDAEEAARKDDDTRYKRDRDTAEDAKRDEETTYRRNRDSADDARRDKKDKADNVRSNISTAKSIVSEARGIAKDVRDAKEKKEKEETRKREREEDTQQSHVAKDFAKIYNYKKINELQPTPVTARVFTVDSNGAPSRSIEVVCGVKANLHPITKKEIIQMMNASEKGDILTQIIRFTTGEISFFRDILLGMGSIKGYAEKMSRFHSGGAKIMASLKRIKEYNRRGDNIKPNASLIVSKAAVEEIKRTSGVDLLDVDEAEDMCNKLGIITFIVSDPLGNKLHILQPDINSEFHVMSTDTLEKQVDAAQDASLTKELRKIISKGD